MKKSTLVEVTPLNFKCNFGPSCPAVFKGDGKHIIIGRFVSAADYAALQGRIGPGEVAIEVESEMLTGALFLEKKSI